MQSQCCISSRFESFINRFSHRNLWVTLRSNSFKQNHVWTEEAGEMTHLYLKCDFWAGEQQQRRVPGRLCHFHPYRFTRADQMKLWTTCSGLTSWLTLLPSRQPDLGPPAVLSQPSWDCVTWALTQNHTVQTQVREDILTLPLSWVHGILVRSQTSC